jgi:hypothetical protein
MQNHSNAHYQHYKNGKTYKILHIGRHSETGEEMVVYQALYYSDKFGDMSIWVRPKTMFFENVIHNGESVPRFKEPPP